ncbi:MAG: hypothetical protein RJA22_1461 [Verrucomicrobiota bacterium]|jgi:ApaG protein
MNRPPPILELPGLVVTIDDIVHHPEVQTPPDQPHCFAYHVTIHNRSEVTVTIRARKWLVTHADGEVTAVEGEGVVGQSPRLEPGESFSYHSFHLFDGPWAEAHGAYFGVDEGARAVAVRIPRFRMEVPR